MDVLEKVDHYNEKELRRLFSERGELLDESIQNPELNSKVWFPGFIINYLFNLDLDKNEAKRHYSNIHHHQDEMRSLLNRDVGFRTAALDYFLNLKEMIKNPRFVEIELYDEILRMTKEDPKTGCYNSQFFNEIVEKEMRRAKRYHQKLSLVLLDIDDFKSLNDNYGHLFGDRVLKSFSSVLRECVRKEDVVGRFGGDEFIILIPQTGRVGARFLAERIHQTLISYFQNKDMPDENVEITFSAGIATYPMDSEDYEGLIQVADEALYKSKLLGKNRIYDYLDEDISEIDTEDPDNPDRRKYARYWMAEDNEIEILNDKNKITMHGKVLNISPNGILMECSNKISDSFLRETVDLQIKKIGKVNLKDITIRANVKRYISSEDAKLKFYIGLEFNRILESEKWHYIQSFNKQTA